MSAEYPYASTTVDAKQALADLTEISSQVEAAVVFDDGGRVAGSTLGDANRAAELAHSAGLLLAAAEEVKTGESALTQLEVATGDGSVFIVRDGKTSIAATTGGNPTVGLVFYDLKSALRALAAQPAATRTPAKKATTAAKKTTAAAKKRTATTKKKTASRKPATRKKKPDAS
jgi:predicted regulator of Ras-like GTPase activity (Roadblock/LC7/MglB family)